MDSDAAPPAPWTCRCDALVWLHRASPAALGAVPRTLRARVGFALTVGAVVRYRSSPVGGYREVLACPALLRGVRPTLTVPFVGVDSLASLRGGRDNWALPKSPARVDGEPADGRQVRAAGENWTVRAAVQANGPTVPLAVALWVTQVWPDGQPRRFLVTLRGRARCARARVDVVSEGDLAAWLEAGTHHGLLWRGARLRVHPPA